MKTLLNGAAKQILDFGCGAGGFVYLCQKNGLDAWGLELNVNAVAKARAVGIRNISSSDLASLEASRFDVITCLHVFEHLADCRSVISEFNRVLRPGGLVLTMTPSYDSFSLKLRRSRYWNFPYQHMNAFNSRSMDAMFLAEKFRRRRTAGRWLLAGPLLTRKCRLSMALSTWCGNNLNVFPTKLLCVYEKETQQPVNSGTGEMNAVIAEGVTEQKDMDRSLMVKTQLKPEEHLTAKMALGPLSWPLVTQLAFLLTNSTLTFIVAWLSWHLYEKRFVALKHRFAAPPPQSIKLAELALR